jgi:hypothetical protein
MERIIILGYDVMTYNGEQPNCMSPKFLSTIHSASDFYYSDSLEFYTNRWNNHWALYNTNMYNNYAEKKSVYEIKEDRKIGKNYDWFYIIEPFASLENFFGNNPFYNEFALNNISKVALDEIVNGNGKLLINYICDGGTAFQTKNFEKIVKFTKENNIDDEKVYFIFADFELKNNLKNLGVNYKVMDYSYNMLTKAQEFDNKFNNPDFSYWGNDSFEPQFGKVVPTPTSVTTPEEFIESIGKDKKDFLLLSRHWKLHRLLLLSHLHKLGLENNLVSWDNKFYIQYFIDLMYQYDRNEEFGKLVTETSSLLDVQDLTIISGFGFENKDIYLNSYLSIVTESVFFQEAADFPSGYLSEKVFKPIGHCQPFILAGPAKSLEYLQNRFGYKTFHPYIDESYDMEYDDFKRLELIKIEIDKFANKTKQEKDEFLNNVKNICLYNQKLFLEYGKSVNKPLKYNSEMEKMIKFLIGDNLI